jgi:hypothetical protein
MGYTRYWKISKSLDAEKFIQLKDIFCMVVDKLDIPLDDVELSDEVIRFNGVGDNAHETFVLEKNRLGFDFCKTQRKPYDALVCACLYLSQKLFDSDIDVSSDGDNNDPEVESLVNSIIRNEKINHLID